MSAHDDRRAEQVAAMADPLRVTLLGLVLSHPDGQVASKEVATAMGKSLDEMHSHLSALTRVGLLSAAAGVHDPAGPEGYATYRPTHDALVRFGGLVTALSSGLGEVGDHERILRSIVTTLSQQFEGVVAAETVREFVWESYDLIASRARVRQFLPQLTERFAADRLEALASLEGPGARTGDDVLFVCVRNAGRSQIAAALMRERAGQAVRVRTAGSVPGFRLDPVVQTELARRGIDTLTEFPRPLTTEVVRASGVVVTMGCGDACPVIPGRRYVDWPVADPVGRPVQEVRRIIEDISVRVGRLLVEMGAADS